MGQDHHHGHSHSHAVSADADSRKLGIALALIVAFMAGEVVAGIVADSLALLSDAAHMLTDAVAIALALVALRLAQRPARGSFTYGLRRAEILSAAVNGVTLLLLGAFIVFEGIRRLIDPPDVEGTLVLIVALIGIPVNLLALRMIASAERRSLNVEGAYQHILTDLFAFVATAIAGAVIITTDFARADGIASLMVAATDALGEPTACSATRVASSWRPHRRASTPRGSGRRSPARRAWSRSTTSTSGR